METATQPFTSKATRDWQLGEIAAIEGRAPWPTPSSNEVHDISAWQMGYNFAYRRVHGKDWLPPGPAQALPDDAVVLWRGPVKSSWLTHPELHVVDKIVGFAKSEGIENAQSAIEGVCFAQAAVPADTYIHGYTFEVRIRNPRDHRTPWKVAVSMNYLDGEYDLRPKLETAGLLDLIRESLAVAADVKAEAARKRAAADELGRAFTAVLGVEVHANSGLGDREIGSVLIQDLSREQCERLTALLKGAA